MRRGHIFLIIFSTVVLSFLTNPVNKSNAFVKKNTVPDISEFAETEDAAPVIIDEYKNDGEEGNDEPYKLNWRLLEQISYSEKVTSKHPEPILYPTVNATLKKLKGKVVELNGFVIPIDNNMYALSKNIMASCFFCGMAGPETISGIKFKGKTPRLKTDQRITVRGTFRFNETNPDDWIYHVEDAIIISGK